MLSPVATDIFYWAKAYVQSEWGSQWAMGHGFGVTIYFEKNYLLISILFKNLIRY